MEKNSKKNPERDENLVKDKSQEICNLLEENRKKIEKGELVVYLIDECHLLWGDLCGYVWGAKDERLEALMINERERQTYYGALNYQTKQFFFKEYTQGISENTRYFLKELVALTPESQILIIWDGASSQKSQKVKEYLKQVNQGSKTSEEFRVNCVLFAPNAPEQNPVEDIWLQAKNCLRPFGNKLHSFTEVQWFFQGGTQGQFWDFPKLHKSGVFSEKIEKVNA